MKMAKPCPKCPYKLGQVETPINPCPQCKLEGYKMYEIFLEKNPKRKQSANDPK